MINAILIVIHLIVCVALVGLILMHSGKDSGMGSIGGGGFSFASQASVMERNLTRYTIITGIVFFITTLLLIWRLG